MTTTFHAEPAERRQLPDEHHQRSSLWRLLLPASASGTIGARLSMIKGCCVRCYHSCPLLMADEAGMYAQYARGRHTSSSSQDFAPSFSNVHVEKRSCTSTYLVRIRT
jgi:hypothetical protein